MSFRDYILKQYANQQNRKEIDYSQGLEMGVEAYHRNMTPTELRQRSLAEATRLNQARLQTTVEGQDALLGNTRPLSSDNVRAMTPAQRLQSYISGSNKDPELAYDLENMSLDYLQGKYGDVVANFAAERTKQNFRNFGAASAYVPEREDDSSFGSVALGSIGRGALNIGEAGAKLAAIINYDDSERYHALKRIGDKANQHRKDIAQWEGSTYAHQLHKDGLYVQLADKLKEQTFQRIAAETGNPDLAKAESEKVAEQYHSDLNAITKEMMLNGLGEQAPQILLAIFSGGVTAGIAEATALGISRVVATQAIQKAMPKIVQLGAMVGVGIEAGLQDGTSAYSDAYTGVYDYYNQAGYEADELNDSTKIDALANSPAIQELRNKYPDKTLQELVAIAASNAGNTAGKDSGIYTGISAGLAAPVLSGFSSKFGAGMSRANRFRAAAAAPVVEGITEFGEEYRNIVAPKEAINKATGLNIYDNPELYATDQATQAGLIGAFSGSASSAAGTIRALADVTKHALNKQVEKKETARKEQSKKENQELNKEIAKVVPEVANAINSVNVMGTSETTDSAGNKVEAIDGVLPNKNMSNSHFGEALKEAVEANAKANKDGKVDPAVDYGEFIANLHKATLKTNKELLHEKGKSNPNQEKINQLEQSLKDQEVVRKKLFDALNEDIKDVAPTYLDAVREITDVLREMTTLQEKVNSGEMEISVAQSKMKDLQEQQEKLYNQVMQQEKYVNEVNELMDSKLYELLADDTYNEDLHTRQFEKIDLSNFTGTKPTTFNDVLYSMGGKDILDKVTSDEEANQLVSSWFKQLGEFSLTNSDDAVKKVDTLFKLMKDLNQKLEAKGYSVPYLAKLADGVSQFDLSTWSDKEAYVFLNKFLTKTDTGKSILDLFLTGSTSNKVIADKAKAQLAYFLASQERKLNALLEAKATHTPDENGKYNPAIKNIETGKGITGQTLYLKDLDGNIAEFTNVRSLDKYIQTVEKESELFAKLGELLTNNKESAKATKSTKSKEVKSSEPETVTPSEPEATTSGSENTSKPTQEKTASKPKTVASVRPIRDEAGNRIGYKNNISDKLYETIDEAFANEEAVKPTSKQSEPENKQKSLVEPIVDNNGQLVGYSNIESGKTYNTEAEALADKENAASSNKYSITPAKESTPDKSTEATAAKVKSDKPVKNDSPSDKSKIKRTKEEIGAAKEFVKEITTETTDILKVKDIDKASALIKKIEDSLDSVKLNKAETTKVKNALTKLKKIQPELDLQTEKIVKETKTPNQEKKEVKSSQPKAEETINVYSRDINGYESLSNLAYRPFKYQNREYVSVEHAYQTLKSGQFDNAVYTHPDWNKVKQGAVVKKVNRNVKADTSISSTLMKALIKESFKQNPTALDLLKSTGNAKFTHNSPTGNDDKFWQKEFPKLLQEVRQELINEPVTNKTKSEPEIKRAKLTQRNGVNDEVFNKDVAKSSIAGKFIGFGSENSSTDQYRKDWEKVGLANTGNYTNQDIVFVSVNGNRKDRVTINDAQFKAELDAAINAKTAFVTDPKDYRESSKYNIGEIELADYLKSKGYNEYTYNADGVNIGYWTLANLSQNTNKGVTQYANTEELTQYSVSERLSPAIAFKVITDDIKANSKTILDEKLQEAFAKLKEKVKDPDSKISERTKKTFGLDDESGVSFSELNGGLNLKTKDIVYSFGYLEESNLLDDYKEVKSENYSVDNVVESLNKYLGNKDSNEATEAAKELLLALKPDIDETVLNDSLSEDNFSKTKQFLNNFAFLVQEVNHYLHESHFNPFSKGENNTLEGTYELNHFNGFLNLTALDENNKPIYDANTVIGIAKTVMEYIIGTSNNSLANNKVLQERFSKDAEEGYFKVFNTSLLTDGRIEGSATTAENKAEVTIDVSVKDNEIIQSKTPLPTDDISYLGRERSKLTQELGQLLLSNMNYSLVGKTPLNVRIALTQSLGTEVLGILANKNLVDFYTVQLGANAENSVKSFWVGTPYNNNYGGKLSTTLAKQYRFLVDTVRGVKLRLDKRTFAPSTKSLISSDKANNSWILPSVSLIEVSETALAKELFKDAARQKGYSISADGKVIDNFSSKNVSDKVLNNTPDAVELSVRAHNAVGYKLDLEMASFASSQLAIFSTVAGYESVANKNLLPKMRESIEARNSMVIRTIGSISTLIEALKATGDVAKARVFIDHASTETQRVQQLMENNPNSNKIMREILRADTGSFSEVEQEFSKLNKVFEFDMSDTQSLFRPVEIQFKLPKADSETGLRDVNFLIKQVRDLRTKMLQSKEPSLDIQNQYNNQAGLLLALAQALGIKIERKSSENILGELSNVFEEQAWVSEVIEQLNAWQQDSTIELNSTPFTTMYKELGNGAMRALSVLMAFSRYMHGKNNTNFDFNVYLEADGIGNGMSNLIRQFTVGFTPTYIQTLKRVGISTLDMISETLKTKDISLNSKTSKYTQKMLAEHLDGSAAQFDSVSGNNVEDVYEVVASDVVNQLRVGFTPQNWQNISEVDSIATASKNLYDLSLKAKEGDVDAKTKYEFITAIRSLVQLNVLDVVSLKYEDTPYNAGTVVSSLFISPRNKLKESTIQNLPNVKLGIKRALAKLGVTPAMYGGALDGINNQVSKDVISAAYDMLQKLYELANSTENNDDEINSTIFLWNSWVNSVGLIKSSKDEFYNLSLSYNNKNSLANLVLRTANQLEFHKDKVIKNLKYGISSLIYNGVQTVYGESLQNARSLVAFDSASVNAFALERQDHYKEAQRARNLKAGYSDTDPRRNDALPEADLKRLMSKITTLPIMATAFSGDAILTDDVLRQGHTIAKDRIIDKEGDAYTGAAHSLVRGKEKGYEAATFIHPLTFNSMVQRIKSYSSGGATNFTNSVVSTESMVQVAVNHALAILNKGLLNVFDGLDADSRLAKVVGAIANQAYDQIHKAINLQENLFHRANKGNLYKFTEPSKVTENLKKNFFNLIEQEARTKKKTAKGRINPTLVVNREELQYLDNLFGYLGSRLIADGEFRSSAIAAQGLREVFTNATTALLSGNETVNLEDYTRGPNQWQEVIQALAKEYQSDVTSAIHEQPFENWGNILYVEMMDSMARKAAIAAATKAVEAQHLSYVVNQFAGANRGYVVNGSELFGKNSTKARFEQFAKENPHLNQNVSDSSELLNAFIQNDSIIQKTFKETFDKKYKELSLNLPDLSGSGSGIVIDNDVITFKEMLSKLTPLFDKVSDTEKNSLAFKTRQTVFAIANKYLPKDTKVFFSVDEYVNALTNSGNADAAVSFKNNNPLGANAPNIGIYLRKDLISKPNFLKIFTHELTHAVLQQMVHIYYHYSYKDRIALFQASKDASRDEKQTARELSQNFERLMRILESNAIKFAKLYESDPDVRRLLENNIDKNIQHIYRTSNKGAAISAAINKAFNGVNLDSDTISKEERSKLAFERYTAINEFLAYGLTEEELLSRIFYAKKADNNLKYAEDGTPHKNNGVIQRVLNILSKIKTDIVNFFFGNARDSVKDESMLFEVLSTVNELSHIQKEFSDKLNNSETLYHLDDTEIISTDSHDLHLNQIIGLVRTNYKTGKYANSNEAKVILAEKELNLLSDNYAVGLRNAGITVTPKEEAVLNMLSGVNEIAYSGSNPELRTEAEKYLNQVLKELKTNNVFSEAEFEAIFGDRTSFDLPTVMATISSVRAIKEKIEGLPQPSKKRLNTLNDKLTDMTAFLKANREIVGFKNNSTLDKITLATVHAELNQVLDNNWLVETKQKEQERYLARTDFAKQVESSTKFLPKTFSAALNAVVSDWAFASNLDGSGKDTDSIIGAALQDLADNLALDAGRTTFITQALRWVLQAREKTQYIYDGRAKFAANMEAIRESGRNVVPTVIRQKFGEDNFNEDIDDTIANAVIPTELHRLYSGSNMKEIKEILSDSKKREAMISDLEKNLLTALISDVGVKYAQEVLNWIKWQVSGLGSLMINREAASEKVNVPHYILPNSRAIASLTNVPIKGLLRTEEITNYRVDAYGEMVGKLATLHSLNHVDKAELRDAVRLIEKYPAGMEEVLNSSGVVSEQYGLNHFYNLLGTDGYVHTKSDPHKDIKLVYENSPDYDRLVSLGYHKVQNLNGTNLAVMYTNINPIKRYQTGMFGLAETSVFGTSIRTYEALDAVAMEWTLMDNQREAYRQEFAKVSQRAMKNPNYYSSLGSNSSIKPVISSTGFIKTYSAEVPNSIKHGLIEYHERGIESIGNLQGRSMEEAITQKLNRQNVELLNQEYKRSPDKKYFIKIDGEFKIKGTSNADKFFEERVNEFYNNLPRDTKEFIKSQGGLYVYRTEVDNILGYRHADLTDIYTNSTPLPDYVKDIMKGLFSVFGLVGVNPVKALKVIQGVNQEVVSYGKNIVLNRSITVGTGNLLSNAVHLVNIGVPHKKIVPDAREGLINAQNYVRNFNKMLEVSYRLNNTKLSAKDKLILEPELKFLRDSLEKNPVEPLVRSGILSSISGAAGYEKTFDTSTQFTYLYKAKDKLGLNKYQEKFDNSTAGNIINNILITRDTASHEFMEKALDYGDFVAKYILYKHLVQSRGFSHENAINVIREEFVNYTMNRGSGFDFANAMGLTWFASYALGIQKVIYRALRKNTLGTLAIYSGGSVINDYDRLGLLGTVPHQNLFERSWDYTTDSGNILHSFESFYLARLLAWLF